MRLLVALCLVGGCLARVEQLDSLWQTFIKTYNKKYSVIEEPFRRSVWEQNAQHIQVHNIQYNMGLHTFTMGVNEYTDLTHDEYKTYMMGSYEKYADQHYNVSEGYYKPPRGFKAPSDVDWRAKGYVTKVKNQGQCGSCWAFSACAALEGANFKATGKLVDLSTQNLVDCVYDEGCHGGWMDKGFKWVKKNGGIDTWDSYPYEEKTISCRFDPANVGGTCTGFTKVPKDDEAALMTAAGDVGPISIAIDASPPSFMGYSSGIYAEPACTDKLTHAMTIVGYGSEGGKDFWIVKNSWGESWGEAGYVRIIRGQNMCGIAHHGVYPLV